MLDYPYFPDIRDEGLNQEHPITRGLPQLVSAWASPIDVDLEKNAKRKITELIKSSSDSWLSESLDILPSSNSATKNAFQRGEKLASQLLGIISEGQFASYFSEKGSPLLNTNSVDSSEAKNEAEDPADEGAQAPVISGVIAQSPEAAQIVLVSSNDFLRDTIVQITGSANGSRNLSAYQLLANVVDWALEDEGLLSIRSRGKYNRTLPPMERETQRYWELGNYVFAAIAILLIVFLRGVFNRRRQRYFANFIGSDS